MKNSCLEVVKYQCKFDIFPQPKRLSLLLRELCDSYKVHADRFSELFLPLDTCVLSLKNLHCVMQNLACLPSSFESVGVVLKLLSLLVGYCICRGRGKMA